MMKVEADSVISVPPKDIWDVMFDPDHKIFAEVQGAGALGKIEDPGVVELKDEENHSTRFVFSTEVNIKGPMASMKGGFMDQVAHSLVRQSLDTFSQKMEMSKQETSSGKSVKQPAPQTNPGIIKMVLNSIWEVTLKKLLRLFGMKR